MSDWITVPSPPLLHASAPLLIEARRVEEFRRLVTGHGGTAEDVDVGGARGTADVVSALKNVLAFPSWCGSSWDSIEDAFAEIRAGSSFPVFALVHGLRGLVEHNPHLAFEIVIRLNALSDAFSSAGDQFVAVFVADRWT